MKLKDLKKEIVKYQYFEDTDIIDVSIASIVANRLRLGDPVWMIIIGPSSGGKSQILRPLALTDKKFIHRVDDLTENTFLSGMVAKGGGDISLLNRIGPQGIIVLSDLTVLFSKDRESRAAILSQLRMIYDGEMTKFAGNKNKPITWNGYLGILAGSTPSIYFNFEEVADMGERFIYYRMKDYDVYKATELSMNRTLYGRELDDTLSNFYGDYIKEVVLNHKGEIHLPNFINERIVEISVLAEKIRTTPHFDWKGTVINKIPVAAMPMRVALQLTAIAKGLMIIRKNDGEEMGEKDLGILDWCGYSLANEEKRASLRVLGSLEWGEAIKTQVAADQIGLSTEVVNLIFQNLTATGVVIRSGGQGELNWMIKEKRDWEAIRRIEKITDSKKYKDREISDEEEDEKDKANKNVFENW